MRFRTILTLVISALIAIVVAATVGSVMVVLDRTARARIAGDLARSAAAFRELEGYGEEIHRVQAQVVAEEPRLKAVSSAEDVTPETVLEVATELRKASQSELLLITDTRGGLLADTDDPTAHGRAMRAEPLVEKALSAGESSGVWVRGARAYQVEARRLSLGREPIGVLVLGYAIDDRFVSEIERLTGSGIVLELDGRVVARSPLAARIGLSESDLAAVLAAVPVDGAAPTEVRLAGKRMLASVHARVARADGGRLRFVVLRSLDEALASARSVEHALFVIAALGLALASLVAVGFSRTLSRPIDRLVAFIQRVGAGHLDERIRGEGPVELRALGDALDRMVVELGESRRKVAEKEQLERDLVIAARIQAGLSAANDALVKARDEAERAHRGTRLILDNMGQGFLVVDRDGGVAEERSAVVDTWLGSVCTGAKIWEAVTPSDPTAGQLIELGWSALQEDFLPLEVIVDQLPRRMVAHGKHYQFSFRPVMDDGDQVACVVVVLSDVTNLVERERLEAAHSELVTILGRVAKDRSGFAEFVATAGEMVGRLISGSYADQIELMRLLHTLKGDCGIFGLASVARCCHDLESRLLDTGETLTNEDRTCLAETWRDVRARLSAFLGAAEAGVVRIGPEDYRAFVSALSEGASRATLAAMVERWTDEPVAQRLERLGEQARALAVRLDKPGLEVVIEDNGVRLPRAGLSRFWSAFVHVVRNAVDHGVESPDERIAQGKPPEGHLTVRTALVGDELIVALGDDGRGIDWEAVAVKARQRGLPAASRADLEEALFSDGLSTRCEATEISGRGVGMAAVREACRELGGRIRIDSTRGAGTLVQFHIPRRAAPRDGRPIEHELAIG